MRAARSAVTRAAQRAPGPALLPAVDDDVVRRLESVIEKGLLLLLLLLLLLWHLRTLEWWVC